MALFYDGAILYQIIISYSQLHRYTIVSCVSPVFRFQISPSMPDAHFHTDS